MQKNLILQLLRLTHDFASAIIKRQNFSWDWKFKFEMNLRKEVETFWFWHFGGREGGGRDYYYRVCQWLWPSLAFANGDIETQNFWALSKSQVYKTYLCMHFFVVITLAVLTKVSIMKLQCTVINRTWQHDLMMKQIFFSSIFSGWLAKHAGSPGHNPWHTWHNIHEKTISSKMKMRIFKERFVHLFV